ncbi:MAG: histidinol phosphate phosphatase domain-containing protein [Nitrospirae bacterium]|nr:histidinol phosphate phosphatase domain-containing protein [Nitrospirota bacterium]
MIDLHTHCLMSDGVLVPAELVRRAEVKGYRAMAITDHADSSNLDFIIPRVAKAAEELTRLTSVKVIPGIEITHVPPAGIARLVKEARALGAKVVVVHGETLVEPVIPGTNRAAIMAGADIVSHPGLISRADAALAAKKGVHLEISARKGHSLSNGHVAKMATETGAKLVINTDAHEPGDLITREFAVQVLEAAGLDDKGIKKALDNSREIVDKIFGG